MLKVFAAGITICRMYQITMEAISDAAKAKATLCNKRPLAYLVHSAMAGVYLGFGVVLVFALSTTFYQAQSPALSLIMGTTFGIALSLVVMAGAELFTGNTMIMVIGMFCGKTNKRELFNVWSGSYIGNFLGSIALAYIASKAVVIHDPEWILTVASKKMNAG